MRPDVARGVRPDGARGAGRRRGAADHERLPVRRRAGVLWRRHPDPRWVARPGESLHRYGTELDLGPPAAYGWLAAQREARSASSSATRTSPGTTASRSTPAPRPGTGAADGRAGRALPSFVPARFAPALARAAQRWNVSAALLAAQLYAESNFNPFATSPAGAQGIAQFMPETARAMGLDDPFDADAGDRRAGAADARPAAPLRRGAARAGGLQRRPGPGRGVRLRAAVPRDARVRRADPRAARRDGRARRGRTWW